MKENKSSGRVHGVARWAVGAVAAVAVAAGSWTAPGAAPTPPSEPGPWVLRELGMAGAGPSVAVPWSPGRPELGVQVYWVNNPADSDEVVLAKARRLFAQVIGMEANSVAVSFPFFTESLTASAVHADARTPSPTRVALVMSTARRAGLRTSLRPLLDEENLVQQDARSWRGKLKPADLDAWYASYEAFLTPYLDVAQRIGVDSVVLAAELNSLQGDPHWAPVVGPGPGRLHGPAGLHRQLGLVRDGQGHPGRRRRHRRLPAARRDRPVEHRRPADGGVVGLARRRRRPRRDC